MVQRRVSFDYYSSDFYLIKLWQKHFIPWQSNKINDKKSWKNVNLATLLTAFSLYLKYILCILECTATNIISTSIKIEQVLPRTPQLRTVHYEYNKTSNLLADWRFCHLTHSWSHSLKISVDFNQFYYFIDFWQNFRVSHW